MISGYDICLRAVYTDNRTKCINEICEQHALCFSIRGSGAHKLPYLLTYLPPYLLTYLLAYLLTYLVADLINYFHNTYLHSYLVAYLLT